MREMSEVGSSEVTGPVRRVLLISAGASHSVALLCKLLISPVFSILGFLVSGQVIGFSGPVIVVPVSYVLINLKKVPALVTKMECNLEFYMG